MLPTSRLRQRGIDMDNDSTVWLSKSFGLFYLIAMSIGIVVYAYWPSNRQQFDEAAQSILDKEDKPFKDSK